MNKSSNVVLKTDARFENLLIELSAYEQAALRESIQREGCREAICTWRGVIVDGHNRYAICQELGQPYKVREMDFANADAVMDWIDANQLARRNLTPDAFKLTLGRRYNRTKKAQGQRGPGKKTGQVGQSFGSATSDRLALEHGVSEHTVRRAGKFATEVEDDPELQEAIRKRLPISKAKKAKGRRKRRDRSIEETREAAAGRAEIRHGDCMEVLADVPPIDLLLTDPPYFTEGDFTAHVSAFLARVKPTGQAYVFTSADPDELAAYLAMERHGMTLEQVLVWNYNNTGQRQPKRRFNSNFQVAFYFRGQDAPDIVKPSDGTHQYACQTVNAPDGRIGDRFHKWQKPLELIERYIANSSKAGDLVCDPFAGTGTTLLAAAKHGCQAIGSDTDKRAIKIAVERGCVLP